MGDGRSGSWTPLLSQDVVYVGGGNTANLLAVWHARGVADEDHAVVERALPCRLLDGAA